MILSYQHNPILVPFYQGWGWGGECGLLEPLFKAQANEETPRGGLDRFYQAKAEYICSIDEASKGELGLELLIVTNNIISWNVFPSC